MHLPPSSCDRRAFLGAAAAFTGTCLAGAQPGLEVLLPSARAPRAELFPISLAQWSLHRTLHKKELDNLDFPKRAKAFGCTGVEYVNSFWKDKARDATYVAELKKRCDGEGITSVLIMCDGEGALGDPDGKKRAQAVTNHHQWVDAAKALGCRAIRVNAHSEGSWEEQQKLAADGLRSLCEHGDRAAIDVIVENHGGLSSNGRWLAGTLAMVKHPRCGSLPDFGNFRVSDKEQYDRYQGVDELMPFARGVSAKSHAFDAAGNETGTDYVRMLDIVVKKHGWRGFIGIEYEGSALSEHDGIVATKQLLERVRAELQRKLDAEKPNEKAKANNKENTK